MSNINKLYKYFNPVSNERHQLQTAMASLNHRFAKFCLNLYFIRSGFKNLCVTLQRSISNYRKIALLGLPADQWMILKHDLHYSHTDVAVLNFMKENRIASLFVPAKCTDEIQECDVVINKPYKDGVRQAFRDHIDDNFQKHCDNGLEAALWEPKITMGNLKPFITSFVNHGMEKLKTPEMVEAIKTCFAERGFFSMMRSPMMQLEARQQLEQEAAAALALIEQVPVSEGDELDDAIALEDIFAFALEIDDRIEPDFDENAPEDITE